MNDPVNQQSAVKYYCEVCKDELEYINTNKQWYCYMCQRYESHPAPSEQPPVSKPLTPAPEPQPKFESQPEKEPQPEKKPEVEPKPEQEPEKVPEVAGQVPESTPATQVPAEDDDTSQTVDWSFDDTDEQPENETGPETETLPCKDEDSEDAEDAEIVEYSSDEAVDFEYEEGSEEGSEEIEFEAESVTEIENGIEFEPESEFEAEESDVIILTSSGDESEVEQDKGYLLATEKRVETEPELILPKTAHDLKRKALNKLHDAWLKVNNLKGLILIHDRINELEAELKQALDGDLDPRDAIVLADESIEEITKLEKELKEKIHQSVSDLFHFVNSKIHLARKIGFKVDELEEELDNISALIARSEYHRARKYLDELLKRIYDLPKTQDEILIGMDEHSDILNELLQPHV